MDDLGRGGDRLLDRVERGVLAAVDTGGAPLGTIRSVQNFGAGDVIELEGVDGTTEFLPFTRAVVPEVDIEGGRVVIDPPDEIEVRELDEETSE